MIDKEQLEKRATGELLPPVKVCGRGREVKIKIKELSDFIGHTHFINAYNYINNIDGLKGEIGWLLGYRITVSD